MSRKAMYQAIPFAIAVILAGNASSQPAVAGADALADCFVRQSQVVTFSGVVAAARGEESFVRTAGHLDAGGTVAMTPDARFRLASVQKVLTKVAVGQLVDKGLIDLDRPIGDYLPGLPPEIAAATVDQLVKHRSGIASMTLQTPQMMAAVANAKTARDLVPLVVSQPLSFRPGERQQYSNGGYFLLGALIEQVSGKEYGRYLEDSIFKPLGMKSSSLSTDERTAVGLTRMVPGQPPLAKPRPVSAGVARRGTPAGDGISTAGDLIKLARALSGDTLVSKPVKERLFPRKGAEWRVGQSGGTMGVNADFAAFPDTGWSLVVLSNFDPPAGELMGEALGGVILGKGCTVVSPKDRPSPFKLLQPPNAPQSTTS